MTQISDEQNKMVQALQYAKIKSFISTSVNKSAVESLGNLMGIRDENTANIETEINKVLDNTTIKRACCLGREGPPKADNSTGVSVKIPIPLNHQFTGFTDETKKFYEDYGYINRTVYVNPALCPADFKPYTESCNNFMQGYCTNQWELFKRLTKDDTDNISAGENFPKYLPECSCFGRTDPRYEGANIARKCYMKGCSYDPKKVYLDKTSRKDGQPVECNMTICNAIVQNTEFTAGKNINVDSQINQNCGPQIKDAQAKADKAKAEQDAAKKLEEENKKKEEERKKKEKEDKDKLDAENARKQAEEEAKKAEEERKKKEEEQKKKEKEAAEALLKAQQNPNDTAAQKKAEETKKAAAEATAAANAAKITATAAEAKAKLAEKQAEGGGMSMGLIIGVVVVLLIIIGAVAFFMMRKSPTPATAVTMPTAPVSVPEMVPQ